MTFTYQVHRRQKEVLFGGAGNHSLQAEFLDHAHLIEVQRSVTRGSWWCYCCLEERNDGKCAQWSIFEAILGSFWLYVGAYVMKKGKSGWFVTSLGLDFGGGGGKLPPPVPPPMKCHRVSLISRLPSLFIVAHKKSEKNSRAKTCLYANLFSITAPMQCMYMRWCIACDFITQALLLFFKQHTHSSTDIHMHKPTYILYCCM